MPQPIGCPKAEAPQKVLNASWDLAEKTLWVYDDLDNRSLQDVVAGLAKLGPEDTVLVRINSYGGDAFAGLALYNVLRSLEAKVITQIDGIAASAAALVALSGHRVRIGEHGMLFFHRAWTNVMGGNVHQLRAIAAELEKIDTEIAAIIQRKTEVSEETVYQWLDGASDGTLFSAKEAVELGFVDEIVPASEGIQDCARWIACHAEPKNYIPDNPPGGDGEGVEGEWEKPTLQDFTDKPWDELTPEERRAIAQYFGFALSLDTFGDLKLPHHFPPNHPKKGKASLAGVRNALARLPLTEGLTEADREKVRQHLRSHLPTPEDFYREILTSAWLVFATAK